MPVVASVIEQFAPRTNEPFGWCATCAALLAAIALGADELVLVADVPGVIADGIVLRDLDVEQAVALIDNGTARDGMAAKLHAAQRAVELGVARVRIGNIEAIRSATAGTAITLSPTAV